MKKLALEPQAVIAYDNFNFKDTVCDQVLGSSKSVMHNMTSGLLIVSPSLPSSGLKQSMIDPKQPLTLNDILLSPGLHRDQVSKEISLFFIMDAICKIHPKAVASVFLGQENYVPSMPKLQLLTPEKTVLHQLGAIFHDEGTIDGTYGVHHDIWIQKLGFKEEDEFGHFHEQLWLAWGDQKTACFIQTLKAFQSTST